MLTRQEKIATVVDTLLKIEQAEVVSPNQLEVSTDDFESTTPQETFTILLCLTYLPNCMELEYSLRYPNEESLYEDGELMRELQENVSYFTEVPNFLEYTIERQLEIMDFKIKVGSDFTQQLERARKTDVTKLCPQQSSNATAFELMIDEEQLYIKVLRNGKEYLLKNLEHSTIFEPFLRYAEKHQNESFVLTDAVNKACYDIYDLLKRIMRDPKIYKVFFDINEDRITANFKPTYARLSELNTSVEQIERLLISIN